MKRAVVYGDMTSDSTDEQYPTVVLCEECIRADESRKEESQVVSIEGEAGPDDGPCAWCDAESDA